MPEPKRPGRPPLDPSGAPSAAVKLRLAPADFDAVERIARERRASVQDVIRQTVKKLITDERGGTF